jgi:hypothetical protein
MIVTTLLSIRHWLDFDRITWHVRAPDVRAPNVPFYFFAKHNKETQMQRAQGHVRLIQSCCKTSVIDICEALRERKKLYSTTEDPPQEIVREMIQQFKSIANQEYDNTCQEKIIYWQGKDGFKGSTLRTALANYPVEPAEKMNAIEFTNKMKACAKEIQLIDHFLFRGLFSEHEAVEEFTSTSLSVERAISYKPPLMIIYVPKKKVHGLVIKTGNAKDKDCEILLIDPISKLVQYTENDAVAIKSFIKEENLLPTINEYELEDKDMQIWRYDDNAQN